MDTKKYEQSDKQIDQHKKHTIVFIVECLIMIIAAIVVWCMQATTANP